MTKDLLIGIKNSLKAFRFVFDNKIGHYFIYPVIITFLLIISAKLGIDSSVDWITEYLYEITNIVPLSNTGWPDTWKDWGQFIAEKTISISMWIIMYFVAHKILKYIVLILMSPVMALLSERTEKIVTGNQYIFSLKGLLWEIGRGVILATRNIIIETGLVVLIWLANIMLTSFFPPITILTSPISLILGIGISAYFYGFSTIDYINERKKMSINDSIQFVRKNKWLAIGNGLVFWGLISIPILGTYIGTIFAPILCSSGAVLALNEKTNLRDSNYLQTESERFANS